MKKSFGLIVLTAMAMVLIGAGSAAAQTPDFMTPSVETICDMESGAAFGLCNAYCEAMDCELANDNDPLTEPKASANACSKVRGKFMQFTGRDLPCEVTCPCNDPAVSQIWSATVAGEVPIDFCFDSFFLVQNGAVVGNNDVGLFAAAGEADEGVFLCAALDTTLPISEAQAAYCVQQLEDASALFGVTCGAPPI
jgi:hypothetical protein